MTIILGKELNRISRIEKHSHRSTNRLDIVEERISRLKNGCEDKKPEGAR